LAIKEVLEELSQYTMTLAKNDVGLLYRVRKTSETNLGKKDFFHLPFEKRYKVATQRYSIPGLPCLYLSGSLYTCWEEMGRPPFHELQAAAFWVKDGKVVKVLNFSDRPQRLPFFSSMKKDGTIDPPTGGVSVKFLEERIAANIVLWPLVAACSIVVQHRDAPFKPEYLIPQMLLQWVTNNDDFNGVCYFSTHVRGNPTTHPLPICNLVFPAKVIRPSGRCEHLCDIFKMTEPYAWELLRAIQAGPGMPGGIIPFFDIEFIDGVGERYVDTEFGSIQMKLGKLAVAIIQENRQGKSELGDIAIKD
jgi:hypothetical protein